MIFRVEVEPRLLLVLNLAIFKVPVDMDAQLVAVTLGDVRWDGREVAVVEALWRGEEGGGGGGLTNDEGEIILRSCLAVRPTEPPTHSVDQW